MVDDAPESMSREALIEEVRALRLAGEEQVTCAAFARLLHDRRLQETLLREERKHALYGVWLSDKSPLYCGQSGASSRLAAHLRGALGQKVTNVSRRAMLCRRVACLCRSRCGGTPTSPRRSRPAALTSATLRRT